MQCKGFSRRAKRKYVLFLVTFEKKFSKLVGNVFGRCSGGSGGVVLPNGFCCFCLGNGSFWVISGQIWYFFRRWCAGSKVVGSEFCKSDSGGPKGSDNWFYFPKNE